MNYLTTEDGKPINDNNPLAVKDSGTAGTGITPPTGGTGILGWLSGVYNALVTAGIKIGAGTALIGKVGIDQTTDGTTNRVVAKISQTAGENLVVLSGSNIAVPVDLQFHDIGDLTPLPVKELNASNFVTVVNASIIDNAFHYYNSAVAITPAQMREYRSFKIHIFDTHDQACTNFKIYHNNIAQAFEPVTGMIIYSNGTLLAGTGSKVALLMGKAAGAGADPTLITLPFLEDTVLSGLSFEIKYGTAPTTGTLKIVLEMNR